jgi:hypothetical protein
LKVGHGSQGLEGLAETQGTGGGWAMVGGREKIGEDGIKTEDQQHTQTIHVLMDRLVTFLRIL